METREKDLLDLLDGFINFTPSLEKISRRTEIEKF